MHKNSPFHRPDTINYVLLIQVLSSIRVNSPNFSHIAQWSALCGWSLSTQYITNSIEIFLRREKYLFMKKITQTKTSRNLRFSSHPSYQCWLEIDIRYHFLKIQSFRAAKTCQKILPLTYLHIKLLSWVRAVLGNHQWPSSSSRFLVASQLTANIYSTSSN